MKSRRIFLKAGVAGAAACLAGCKETRHIFPGEILGASHATGHRLRDGTFPAPAGERAVQCVIVGGGIAGLAAARRLHQHKHDDFILLELEPTAGGNSVSGQNSVAAYPWGAHYLPLPNDESTEVIALLEELDLIRGRDASGTPERPRTTSDKSIVTQAQRKGFQSANQSSAGIVGTPGYSTNFCGRPPESVSSETSRSTSK